MNETFKLTELPREERAQGETLTGNNICMDGTRRIDVTCLKQGQRKKLLDGIYRNQSCFVFLDDVLCRMRKECTG